MGQLCEGVPGAAGGRTPWYGGHPYLDLMTIPVTGLVKLTITIHQVLSLLVARYEEPNAVQA